MNRGSLAFLLLGFLLSDVARGDEATLARRDPSTWSKQGYLQFRWGMGPGDVEAALRALDAPLRSEDRFSLGADDYSPAEENYIVIPSGFEIADIEMRRGVFGFDHGRLFRIELNPTVPGAPWPLWREWYTTFSDLLRNKYGKARSEWQTGNRSLGSVWIPNDHLTVVLAASETLSRLVYADFEINERARQAWEARRQAAEKAAVKPTLDKL